MHIVYILLMVKDISYPPTLLRAPLTGHAAR
ncbi:hypothetical protein EDF73_109178 [Raoultella sp. BIGb0138]|nr:hypothetical protein EDF73_109178 [Raoultella sp. BIGb0138]